MDGMKVVYWVNVSESSGANSPGCPGSTIQGRTLDTARPKAVVSRKAPFGNGQQVLRPCKNAIKNIANMCRHREGNFLLGLQQQAYKTFYTVFRKKIHYFLA